MRLYVVLVRFYNRFVVVIIPSLFLSKFRQIILKNVLASFVITHICSNCSLKRRNWREFAELNRRHAEISKHVVSIRTLKILYARILLFHLLCTTIVDKALRTLWVRFCLPQNAGELLVLFSALWRWSVWFLLAYYLSFTLIYWCKNMPKSI